jgi:hypothetical protein
MEGSAMHLLLAASPHAYSTMASVSGGLAGTVIVSVIVFAVIAAVRAIVSRL